MARIYLIEDSDDLREATAVYLRRDGHDVIEFGRADELTHYETDRPPDLYILDIMLPGRSGLNLANEIRSISQTPIIFISARYDEMTKTAAFGAGADDYVVKPYSPRELALRVRAVLRRFGAESATPLGRQSVVRCRTNNRTMTVRFDARRVDIDGNTVSLTKTEWKIIETLCRNADVVVTREQLLHQVFGYNTTVRSRAVDTHIKNLRRKLGSTDWFETVHGQGYRIIVERES